MKGLISLMLLTNIGYSQISNSLLSVSISNNKIQVSRINPNTGNITALGTQSITSLFGGSSYAFNCNSGDYVFGGSTGSNQSLLVVDKNTGNIKNTFGYNIEGIACDNNSGLYYGFEYISGGMNFVSFNPVNGTKNTLTTYSASNLFLNQVGGVIINNNYVTVSGTNSTRNMISFSCQNGSKINSPQIRLGVANSAFSAMCYSKSQDKLFVITQDDDNNYLASINLSTAVMQTISIIPIFQMSGGSNARGGISFDESNGVISVFCGKIWNINSVNGTVISSPSVNADDVFFIQYESCLLPTGILEFDVSQNIESKYYDLHGQEVKPIPGVLLIEQKGNFRRKIVITD